MRLLSFTGLLLLSVLLTGCIPPPKDDDMNGRSASVQSATPSNAQPKSITSRSAKSSSALSRAEEKENKPSTTLKKNQRPQGLPAGWTLVDPKGIVTRVEQEPLTAAVVLFVKGDAGLEVVGARDSSKQERYRGKLDGGHLISLSPATDKVLVLFSNRQNAKFSVLLSYNP
jgi:hypothetical protein